MEGTEEPEGVVSLKARAKWHVRMATALCGLAIVGEFMAALILLSWEGIIIRPLSVLWTAWPSDLVKVIVAVGFALGSIVYLAYAKMLEREAQRAA